MHLRGCRHSDSWAPELLWPRGLSGAGGSTPLNGCFMGEPAVGQACCCSPDVFSLPPSQLRGRRALSVMFFDGTPRSHGWLSDRTKNQHKAEHVTVMYECPAFCLANNSEFSGWRVLILKYRGSHFRIIERVEDGDEPNILFRWSCLKYIMTKDKTK